MKTRLLVADVLSLYYTVGKKHDFKQSLDYNKLKVHCEDNYKITRAMAYGTIKSENSFINLLNDFGYDVNFNNEFNAIPQIIIDIVRMKDNLEYVILATSNRDFAPLIIFLKEIGINVSILGCGIPRVLKITSFEEIFPNLLLSKGDNVNTEAAK